MHHLFCLCSFHAVIHPQLCCINSSGLSTVTLNERIRFHIISYRFQVTQTAIFPYIPFPHISIPFILFPYISIRWPFICLSCEILHRYFIAFVQCKLKRHGLPHTVIRGAYFYERYFHFSFYIDCHIVIRSLLPRPRPQERERIW